MHSKLNENIEKYHPKARKLFFVFGEYFLIFADKDEVGTLILFFEIFDINKFYIAST